MDSEVLWLLAQTSQTRVPVGKIALANLATNPALSTSDMVVPFNTSVFAANGMTVDTANNRIQVPYTGYYVVTSMIQISASSTGNGGNPANFGYTFNITTSNGGVVSNGVRVASNAGAIQIALHDIVYVVATGYITIHGNAAATGGYLYGLGTPAFTFMSAAYLSA